MADQTQDRGDATSEDVEVIVIRFRGEYEREFFAVPVDLIRTYRLGADAIADVRPQLEETNQGMVDDRAYWAIVATAKGIWEPAAAVNQSALRSIGQATTHAGPGKSLISFKSWIPPWR